MEGDAFAVPRPLRSLMFPHQEVAHVGAAFITSECRERCL